MWLDFFLWQGVAGLMCGQVNGEDALHFLITPGTTTETAAIAEDTIS